MAKPTTETKHCARCGTAGTCAPGGIPAGWSIEVDERGTIFVCATCVRTNLRAIEGKLPQEYWEW